MYMLFTRQPSLNMRNSGSLSLNLGRRLMSVINYSVCVFCTLCRHNTALQGLNLEDNRIGDAGAAAIGEGLGYDDCSHQTCSSVFARHSSLNLRDSGSFSLIDGA